MPAPSHGNYRKKVCVLCFNERGKKPKRRVSKLQADAICALLNPTFSLEDFNFPTGICSGCNTALDRLKHGKLENIYLSELFGCIKVPPTDTNHSVCGCQICERGSLNGAAWNKFVAEHKNKDSSTADNVAAKLCPHCLSKVLIFQFQTFLKPWVRTQGDNLCFFCDLTT